MSHLTMEDSSSTFNAPIQQLINMAAKSTGLDLSLNLASAFLQGSMIRYHIQLTVNGEIQKTVATTQESVLEAIRKAKEQHPSVLVAFKDGSTVYVTIGTDSYQTTRVDRGRKSALNKMTNATPLDSPKRPQKFALTFGPSLSIVPQPVAFQYITWFLLSSLRLNAQSATSEVAKLLEDEGWRGWPLVRTFYTSL